MEKHFYTFTKSNKENSSSICRISSLVKLGIDDWYDESFSGHFWTVCNDEESEFESDIDLIMGLNRYYDSINFPQCNGGIRHFVRKPYTSGVKYYKRRLVTTNIDRLLGRKGRLGTFLLRVKYREKQTWQGDVLWLDVGSAFHFESMFELMSWLVECVGIMKEDRGYLA